MLWLELNFAEMLENHELRLPGGVPLGPYLSADPDLERLLGIEGLDPFVVGGVVPWPLVCGWLCVAGFSADVGFGAVWFAC